jgi:GMP synthase (glutamine-hydrolysing)
LRIMDSIAILDFGSQYSQLIARRIREAHVYCELFPCDALPERVLSLQPKGFILSGGPASITTPGAPTIPDYVLDSRLPILGICYGMQALAEALGGKVAAGVRREYGSATIETLINNDLLPRGSQSVWMSHGDRIEIPPPGFLILARSENSSIAAIGDPDAHYYGVQFHPEVRHTPGGNAILSAFLLDICQAQPDWVPDSIIEEAIAKIREQVGNQRAIAGVSGGVDSTVAAALVRRAIGEKLDCIFIDNGLMRLGEADAVAAILQTIMGDGLIDVDAGSLFIEALAGVTDPEVKRRIIGAKFIQVFNGEAQKLGDIDFLMQGTIYPDVVESSSTEGRHSARIKSHHNVGGLPESLPFKLLEPLRYLFKDEVRAIGLALGLPPSLVRRQPFPGPGLAVRCLGEVIPSRLKRLRMADKIVIDELTAADLLHEEVAQAFAVLLPVRSVGVMGDQRTYAEAIAIRAVTSEDFMTADWARLPHDLLARISNRIINEVEGVNRVVYDITSKPPATIEWE